MMTHFRNSSLTQMLDEPTHAGTTYQRQLSPSQEHRQCLPTDTYMGQSVLGTEEHLN